MAACDKKKREENMAETVLSFLRNKGFILASGGIHGGLRGNFDYGWFGSILKREVAQYWWREMVVKRPNIATLDAAILSHSKIWHASQHLTSFTDALVDCRLSNERFRPDKAGKLKVENGKKLVVQAPDAMVAKSWLQQLQTKIAPGIAVKLQGARLVFDVVEYQDGSFIKLKTETDSTIEIPDHGYVSSCNSPFLTSPRRFNLMFRTHFGPVDVVEDLTELLLKNKELPKEKLVDMVDGYLSQSYAYLRPETAQSTYVQLSHYLKIHGLKLPFGIAQIGKSFRNEVTLEHGIFRTPEFEQMELQFFCKPEEDKKWYDYWIQERLKWWHSLANYPKNFVLKEHVKEDLAHYAKACTDIEYQFPWGFGEIEGIANRTDYDLKQHTKHSGQSLEYSDDSSRDLVNSENSLTSTSTPKKYFPYVIEPAAGLNRALLAFLFDAYHEEEKHDVNGKLVKRTVLKLHPKIAPFKAAILPIVKKPQHIEIGKQLLQQLLNEDIYSKYDENGSIGRRYTKHDEIGTPFCITIDDQTLQDQTVTIRDRDTTHQERKKIDDILPFIKSVICSSFFFFFLSFVFFFSIQNFHSSHFETFFLCVFSIFNFFF